MNRDGPTKRPENTRIALIVQGGGSMGAYQAGVYQALEEHGFAPDWIAGASIGFINGAIIAGNPPGERIARLKECWQTVSILISGVFHSYLSTCVSFIAFGAQWAPS